ncbi:hypothetical protein ACEPAI_7103 [Sanghuangporus weigelae]
MTSGMLARNLARRAAAVAATPRSVVSTSRAGIMSQLRFSSTVHDNDPDVLETEKAKNLSGKQHKSSTWDDNAPGWNEYLATASEAAVKADRTEGSPEVLQRKSIEHIRERHHADDITSGKVEAEYERDEVEGPLKDAFGTVTETIEETVETIKTKTSRG